MKVKDNKEVPAEADDGFGWDDGASLTLDVLPFVGSLKSIGQLITGTDLVTGEPVNRWMEAVGIIAGIFPGGKGALKGATMGAKVLKQSDKAADVAKAVKKADKVSDASKVAKKSDKINDVKVVKNNTSIFKSENVLGRKVFKNNRDVIAGKPSFVDGSVNKSIRNKVDDGWTNKELMEAGYAPIGPDGKQINLHHLIGKEPGSMVELSSTFHKTNHKPLHGLIEDGASFRNNPKLQYQYDKFRKQYWKERAKDF